MEGHEIAKENLEHADHAAHGLVHAPHARRAAVVIAVLAAALALCELEEKDAQAAYLNDNIAVSDTWAQYQAKAGRLANYLESAELLQSLPGADDPAVQSRIESARNSADRMKSDPGGDGMDQLSRKARDLERQRDQQAHRDHGLELASSALQLSIVLASVSVVTGIAALLTGAGAIGAVAAAFGIAAALSIV